MENKIHVVIPTRNRLKKLERALKTIPNFIMGDIPVQIHIVCDGDKQTALHFGNNGKGIKVLLIPGHNGAVKCRNYALESITSGHVVYATDDIVFRKNAIENAYRALMNRFPDSDGVIGFHQEGNAYHPTGMGLVGEKFLKRYENNHLFNPKYFHFACQEIHWLADKHGKYYLEKNAVIYHYHPQHHREEMDKAHNEARIYRKKDHDLIKDRLAKGLIWGDN